jgi:hypothetical protein
VPRVEAPSRAGARSDGTDVGAAAFGAAGTAVVPARDGQITPPHSRSLHLKSGAFGFRLPSRLSHIGPRHFGQVGVAAGLELGGVIGRCRDGCSKLAPLRFRVSRRSLGSDARGGRVPLATMREYLSVARNNDTPETEVRKLFNEVRKLYGEGGIRAA